MTPSPLRREVTTLSRLALPIVMTQLGLMLMGMVDLLMVGRVGVEAVGAVSLGNLWKIGTLLIGMGIVFGIDPLVTQAHGARDGRGAGLALQRGIVLSLAMCVPLAISWLFAEPGLRLCGQDPEVARIAARYVWVQLPSLPGFLVWTVLRQYLQGREIVKPAFWVTLIANALNVLLNWVFVFGNLGAPALGAVGSGVATSILQALLPIALTAWIVLGRLHEGGWVPWSRAALDLRELRRILAHGLPIAAQLSFEIWAFQIAVLWAGLLGETELAVHSIVLNLASFSFMVPLGVALAATTRVGNLIGAGRHDDAQRACWVAFGLGAGSMSLFAAAFVLLRADLIGLYSPDATVVALGASVLPIVAAFQVFDGTQVVGAGILRGMGRTRPAALFHLIGFYVLGLPLGWWWTFELAHGLAGLWWGLAVGLCSVSLAFLAWVWWRGPSHLQSRPDAGYAPGP